MLIERTSAGQAWTPGFSAVTLFMESEVGAGRLPGQHRFGDTSGWTRSPCSRSSNPGRSSKMAMRMPASRRRNSIARSTRIRQATIIRRPQGWQWGTESKRVGCSDAATAGTGDPTGSPEEIGVERVFRELGRRPCEDCRQSAQGGEAGGYADLLPSALDTGQLRNTPLAGATGFGRAVREYQAPEGPGRDRREGSGRQ